MYSKKIITLFLFLCFTVVGQQKITIDEMYNGTFQQRAWLLSPEKYKSIYLNADRQSRSMQIDLYDFATLKKYQH
jgi:dipeptidyl-peptidase-4